MFLSLRGPTLLIQDSHLAVTHIRNWGLDLAQGVFPNGEVILALGILKSFSSHRLWEHRAFVKTTDTRAYWGGSPGVAGLLK